MRSLAARRAPEGPVVLRVASGIVLAAFALAVAWAGGLVFVLVCAGAALGMALELASLVGHDKKRVGTGASLLVLACAFVALALGNGLAALGFLLCAPVPAIALGRASVSSLWLAGGVFWCGLAALGIAWLRSARAESLGDTILVLAVVSASDTGAYLAGRLIGGPALLAGLSPNKTWAGLLGGLALGSAAGFAFSAIWDAPLDGLLVAACPALALAALGGDIAESALKRHFRRKDAGALIPGHGGLLDRLDSLVTGGTLACVLVLAQEGGGLF